MSTVDGFYEGPSGKFDSGPMLATSSTPSRPSNSTLPTRLCSAKHSGMDQPASGA